MSVIEPQVVCDMQLLVAFQAATPVPRFQPMVEMQKIDIGTRLRELIKRGGKSQVEVAAHHGVSVQAVQKWLKDGAIAKDHIPALCRFIDCTADELFGLEPIAREVASQRQSQTLAIDLEMLKSAIVSVKEALRSFGLELDAFLAAPMIAYAYEVRLEYPRHMTRAEYRAFDRMLAERLQGELGAKVERGTADQGEGGHEATASHGAQAGRRRRAG